MHEIPQHRGVVPLIQQDAKLPGKRERIFQLYGIVDLGNRSSAGLFRRLRSDSTPAIHSLQGSLGQMSFGATSDDWSDSRNAKLRALFNRPLHAIELENRKNDGQIESGWCGDCFAKVEHYSVI